MKTIIVRLGKSSYPINIGRGTLKKAGSYIARLKLGTAAVVITNPAIKRLYGRVLTESLKRSGISARIATVPDSEISKSSEIFFKVINNISRFDKGERPFIAALGGGVVGDLAGFAAAVYKRGVGLVQIPTTFLAQIDSAIGGKTAIDLRTAKNLVGAFYQPKAVIIDTSLLETLPKREVECGLSEAIKYAVIGNRAFFCFLERNIARLKKMEKAKIEYVVRKCCGIKANVVSRDEKDTKGARALLNYGHTIGHAIEAAAGYGGRYNHGEAVAIGMAAAADLSQKLGMLSAKEALKITRLIEQAGLPVRVTGLSFNKIWNAHLHDKKFMHGSNAFVLPVRIGRAVVVKNLPEGIVRAVVKGRMDIPLRRKG